MPNTERWLYNNCKITEVHGTHGTLGVQAAYIIQQNHINERAEIFIFN
jgi:hypothetical protein